ncbi:EscR/YscR/HrcR family type III secretion system export apparatus protein [Rahnella sp. SAP-1]|uniref:EscR/YscR/HrcR family type III secretion system export apparatus protein n=1 Tax=Rouxiella aceris TaxID=2703884 RepID=A0A848ME76_9GAMM|nr:type III secretion system export apparatus subunit SctR [Rouxiella aceris]NMP25393.1 EscR/YscR/HrcR family type III secretion system export apparatus protein [Rouxiella aceris]
MTSVEQFNPLILTLFLAGLTLLPIFMIICTCFLKIAMVLLLTRNALGVQQIPPNMALYGIALAATMFVMAPTWNNISDIMTAAPPDLQSTEKLKYFYNEGLAPLKHFMSTNTDPAIVDRIIESSMRIWPKEMHINSDKQNIFIIVPGFVLSELQSAFKIGFIIFIPFLAIDLIVSNILLALGMQMISPIMVSLPIKILLFVAVNGWTRLLEGLFLNYQ